MQITSKLILEYSKDLTLLYVEDDDTLRNSTSKIFLKYFKQVDLADNGNIGLEKYIQFHKSNGYHYDLIITNINMPYMNGIEMSKEIIQKNSNQDIIFITAHNELEHLYSAISLGISRFLSKPINADELKSILYKTTQAINDHKMLERYYKNIEETDILLLQESGKLKYNITKVKDIINDIDFHKEEITQKWIQSEGTKEKLRLHSIDEEFFRTHYAIKVLEYFIGVIKGDNEVGNCPVIVAMLEFLKHKHLPLDSVFAICVNFKNTISSFVFEKYAFNYKLFDELSVVLDKNFEGVIFNFMNMKLYEVSKKIIIDDESDNEDVEEEINYCDYVFEHDIYELQDLETEIENLVIAVTIYNQKTLDDFLILGEKVCKYGSLLMSYPIFVDLGAYIFKLGNSFIDNAQLLFEDNERMANISILVEGFVNDLMIWRKEIFENNIANPNFLNASFFSNVDTIIQYIEYNEDDDVLEDEIEFF